MMFKRKITLAQLIAEKDIWELCSVSRNGKYQYYMQHPAPGVWGEIRKIKRQEVVDYLNSQRSDNCDY